MLRDTYRFPTMNKSGVPEEVAGRLAESIHALSIQE